MTEDLSLRALLMAIRYDLTAAQGKLTEAFRQVDALHLEERKDPPTAFNQTAPYVPGELRYLEGARRVWARFMFGENQAYGDAVSERMRERSKTVRVYLEGFTDDAAEIAAHLDALEVLA